MSTTTSALVKHISTAADQTREEILGRRDGSIKSLRVASKKFNKITMNGLEWNKIVTLAGLSGSGKSMILEQWKREFFDYNKDQSFSCLSFEFEMLPKDQILRNISGRLQKSTRELLSIDEKISDEDLAKVDEAISNVTNYPIYYVDKITTVDEIAATIRQFAKDHKLKESGKGLIVTIDHVLLTKGKQNESTQKTIEHLCTKMVELKKEFDSEEMKILIIMIGQLNRDIESKDRVTNPRLHYPNKTDIFGSSHVYFSSDYVIVTHIPNNIVGISTHYGPPLGTKYPNGLPVRGEDKSPLVYHHLIKNRGGELNKILTYKQDFRNSRIIDYNIKNNVNE